MPTAAKIAWIEAEAAAGVGEIEVGSFVPATLLPQLADTAALVQHARTIPGLSVAVLVPNARSAAAVIRAEAYKLTLPLSVRETHSLANLRRTHAQVIGEVREIAGLIAALPVGQRSSFEGSLSTVFFEDLIAAYVPYRRRPKLIWLDGKTVAVCMSPNLEFYEIDAPANPYCKAWGRRHCHRSRRSRRACEEIVVRWQARTTA